MFLLRIFSFLCEPFLKSLFWVFCLFFVIKYFGFFGHEAHGIFPPPPGIEPTPPALEGEVLITGLPGKSQECPFLSIQLYVVPEVLASVIMLRKRKRHPNWKERKKSIAIHR